MFKIHAKVLELGTPRPKSHFLGMYVGSLYCMFQLFNANKSLVGAKEKELEQEKALPP
jgi:hypothetical protein